MPLSARLGDARLESPFISTDAWTALKQHHPRPVLSCGAAAVVKTSHLGTQFFAHLHVPGGDEHKGESREHLRVKAAVMLAARDAGWDTSAEVPADDRSWVADVLAERDGRRVAFEVQLAGQTAEEYRFRQDRYARDGVECFWLVRRLDGYRLREVPAVQVLFGDEPITVTDGPRSTTTTPLSVFVRGVLDRTVTWASHSRSDEVATVQWGVQQCYRCHRYATVWNRTPDVTLTCDGCAHVEVGRPYRGGSVEPVKDKRRRGLEIPSAIYRPSRTSEGSGNTPEWFCPNCDAGFWALHLHWLYYGDDTVAATAALGSAELRPHWCTPRRVITGPADLLRFLDGDLPGVTPPPVPVVLTGQDVIDQARTREQSRKRAKEIRDEQDSMRAEWERWLEDSHARQARFEQQRRPRPVEWWSQAEGPEGPPPPWDGPAPTDPHARTAVINAYTATHLRYADELLSVFPLFGADECTCPECSRIQHLFNKSQRKTLWPHRGTGTATWADKER